MLSLPLVAGLSLRILCIIDLSPRRLVKLVQPMVEPGSQGFVDLAYTPEGALAPETSRVWQFALTLVSVEGLGKTGQTGYLQMSGPVNGSVGACFFTPLPAAAVLLLADSNLQR